MKKTEKPIGWEIEQICTGYGNGNTGCGVTIVVSEENLFATFVDDIRNLKTEYFYTIKCPVCGRLTDIPNYLIPDMIRDKKVQELGKR